MGFNRGLPISSQDIDGTENLLVDIMNKFFDRLAKNLSLRSCVFTMIAFQGFYSLLAFSLLEVAILKLG